MIMMHRTKILKEWKTENEVDRVYRPAHSPDLSPIENVWSYVTKQLQTMQRPFEKLEETICSIWANIPVEHVQKLDRSMPKRMRELRIDEYCCVILFSFMVTFVKSLLFKNLFATYCIFEVPRYQGES